MRRRSASTHPTARRTRPLNSVSASTDEKGEHRLVYRACLGKHNVTLLGHDVSLDAPIEQAKPEYVSVIDRKGTRMRRSSAVSAASQLGICSTLPETTSSARQRVVPLAQASSG